MAPSSGYADNAPREQFTQGFPAREMGQCQNLRCEKLYVADVAFGSKGDIPGLAVNVRFAPKRT